MIAKRIVCDAMVNIIHGLNLNRDHTISPHDTVNASPVASTARAKVRSSGIVIRVLFLLEVE
jgi:hypothetical protein